MIDSVWFKSPPSPMTPEWIGRGVDEIRGARHDDERAHAMEDDLHQIVLEALSRGDCEDVKLCAATALKTLSLDFARWRA